MYRTNPFAPAVGPLYRQVRAEAGVHAATPHELVAMLFEGLLEALAQARGALQAGQVQAKGAAIGRAVAILEEGLGAGLDLNAGALAHDLNRLYSYLVTRLTLANLRSDDTLLQECQNLVRPLQQAWAAIGEPVPA
jgi:flagellar secretion chaperone FliS